MSRAAEPDTTRSRTWLDVGLLLLLAGWLAGVHLANPGLVDPDEPRSALIARLMVERGDWLAPHLPAVFHHNYPHYPLEGDLFAYWEKPPLYFWLCALMMKALGPTALAAHLPSAVSHVAIVLLVYACGRFLWGRRAGLWAGIVMAVALLPLVMAHVARMEMFLVAMMTVMLLALLKLLYGRSGSWRWVVILYVAAGLGILTKGPVAVVFPAAAVAAALLLNRRWGDLRRLHPLAGLAIVLVIAAPWFVYMHFRYPPAADGGNGGFSYAFFVTQHFSRAMAEEFGRTPHFPGYLVGVLLLGFLPWTIFLPAACGRLFRLAWPKRRETASAGAVMLLLAWAAIVVAAFSFSKTQLPYYVAPVVPPLALLVGAYLADRFDTVDRDRLFTFGLWLTVVLGMVGTVAGVIALDYAGLWHSRYLGMVAVMAGLLAAGIVTIRRGRREGAVAITVAAMVCLMTFIFAADPLDVYGSYTTRFESHVLRERLEPGDMVLAFPYTPYSMAWYLWPREVPYPAGVGERAEEPSLPALANELNQPRRTFCMLQKKGALDWLRPRVHRPIVVLSKNPRHMLIVVEPALPVGRPPATVEEKKSHGP